MKKGASMAGQRMLSDTAVEMDERARAELPEWVEAKVRGAVLGYGEQKAFLEELRRQAIEPARKLTMSGKVCSDPTFAAVLRLEKLERRYMWATVDTAAVDAALKEVMAKYGCGQTQDRLASALIGSYRRGRVTGVARDYSLGVSERTFWRLRRGFTRLVADKLGI